MTIESIGFINMWKIEILETKSSVEMSKINFFFRLLNSELTKKFFAGEVKTKFLGY